MQIDNCLKIESFQYTSDKSNMLVRSDEIWDLFEVDRYCKNINEQIRLDGELWNIEVEEGICFADWLYLKSGQGNDELRRIFGEFISKGMLTLDDNPERREYIGISLGVYGNLIHNLHDYVNRRRELLTQIKNPTEFVGFMHSCFQNSIFADDILQEMKNIKSFPQHVNEIVKNLSILNDEAIELFENYQDNLKMAMDILSAKLIECSPDPKHEDILRFSFSYEKDVDGILMKKNKMITCSPHLKLIHPGSNLRIYFQWKDEDVGQNEKVLIGRIGSHPYKQ